MPLPAALTLIPLHGKILKPDSSGTPAVGKVSFRVEQPLRDTTDNVLLAPCTLTAALDATGAFTISLPATDDPDVTPSGWAYLVTIATDVWRDQFRIQVPVATIGTLELADIAPAVSPPDVATYILRSTMGQVGGPAGPLDSSGLIPSAQIPGGGGPSSTVVSETGYGQASSAGSSVQFARGDHTHGSPSLTSATPTASAVGDSGAVGTATTPARADHVHGRESFGAATAQTSFGASSSNGTAATPARSDHAHGTPSLSSGSPTTSTVGDSAAVGSGTTAAKSDHTHGREAFGSVTTQTSAGMSSSNGTAATVARSDHAHGTPPAGTTIKVRSAYITSGNITPPNTSGGWQALGGSFELQLPAAVGDWVEIDVTCLMAGNASTSWDVGVLVSSSIARYLASGTGSPAVDGDPSFYNDAAYPRVRGAKGFTVASGDLDGGNVRFAMVTKSGGAGTLYAGPAGSGYPFYWRAANLGAVG